MDRLSVCSRVLMVGLVVVTLLPATLSADGFRNPPEGARAIGAFGGHTAFADDANSAIHNPANLVETGAPMVQVNLLGGYGRNRFSREGVSEQTEDPVFAIPGFAATLPVADRFAVGLASYVPYGRSVEWKRDGYFAQRGLSYSGSMTVADITPNVAVKVNDSVSVSVGADIYYGRVQQDTLLGGLGALGIPDGTRSRLEADGDGLGWNAAATCRMPGRQRLAVTFRSPFSINYEGDNSLSIGIRTDAEARIQYPTIIALAYGIELMDKVRAEVGGEWLEFSRYRNLTIHDSAFGAQAIPQDLKDTWTAGCGVQWAFRPQWTLRTGYKYLQNPTPDETYSPLSPDEDQGVVSVGLGYENSRHAVDVGYAYGLFDGRRVPDANPAGGMHDYEVQVVSVSYGCHF